MKDFFLVVLVIGLIIFSVLYYLGQSVREEGFVVKVIDGDTIELNNSERVRLLGINTPEKGERFYKEAKKRLEELVLNKSVYLEREETNKDKYGRLLRYVYLGDDMVNLKMIEEGYAFVYIPEKSKYERLFKEAEKLARESKRGIWSLSSEDRCADCIIIGEFHWNADGNDCKNPNGEWVTFRNICPFDCNLSGWILRDSGSARYRFNNFIFKSYSSVKIFSGSGTDTGEEIYWNRKGSCPAVWNNDEDTLYLMDSDERIVLIRSY